MPVKVSSYFRKNGSLVKNHLRKITSKAAKSRLSHISKSEISEGTTKLASSGSLDEAPNRVHRNKVVFSSVVKKNFKDYLWVDSSFTGSTFSYCEFDGGTFKNVDMGANYEGCSLNSIEMENVHIGGSSFVDSDISNCDFREVESFDKAVFYRCDLRGANLSGLKVLLGDKILLCNLKGADLSGADMSFSDISGNNMIDVNWVGANTKGMIASPSDKYNKINKKKRIAHEILQENSGDTYVPLYTQHDLAEAAELMGLTEKQFEFFAHSGVIEIRDSKGVVVQSGFDPDQHHVPAWFVQNFSL
jgi:uncharacterized protein YjbI with pentapeptide repeats